MVYLLRIEINQFIKSDLSQNNNGTTVGSKSEHKLKIHLIVCRLYEKFMNIHLKFLNYCHII